MSLSKLAFTRIRDAIVSGDLAFGERLSEVQIAEALEMSKAPVRTAFLELRDRRLVTIVPQAGTQMAVTCPPGCGAGDTVAIATPSGQQVQVQIPTGVVTGQVFNVQLPAAPPVVSAVAIPMGGHAA